MTYIIGEIGQNHNGSVDIAKTLVEIAARMIYEKVFKLELGSFDAVKLTKRDLQYELTKSKMNEPYNSPNSFGSTYGEHRNYLELNDEEHFEIYKCAKKNGLDFIETLCHQNCLSILKLFYPDKLKVASRDLTNIPLLIALSETKIPIIISTGMSGKKDLDNALNVITKEHSDISILHCTSEYPTQPKNVNLNSIRYLRKNYTNYTIGFSDHTIGISAPISAVAMGAEIIEKHITLDRGLKGSDQKGSLGIDGMERLVRDIRLYELYKGKEDLFLNDDLIMTKVKLERSIATNKPMKKGDKISITDIHLLSPGDGFKWINKSDIVGSILNCNISKDEIIYKNMLE